jgi:ankyrin repeat protein
MCTTLQLSLAQGSESSKRLIDGGEDLCPQDTQYQPSPLSTAMHHGNPELVRRLLEAEAKSDAKETLKASALP